MITSIDYLADNQKLIWKQNYNYFIFKYKNSECETITRLASSILKFSTSWFDLLIPWELLPSAIIDTQNFYQNANKQPSTTQRKCSVQKNLGMLCKSVFASTFIWGLGFPNSSRPQHAQAPV